jgi:plasmid stabilization system protein ParE
VSGYVLGRGAESDLDAIWEYIAQDNVDAADRWIGKLFDAFECLGQSPGSQTRGSDTVAVTVLGGGHVSDHLSERSQVEIVAVTQGSRDIPAFLQRRVPWGE